MKNRTEKNRAATNRSGIWGLFAALVLGLSGNAEAVIGISTRFVDVTLEYIEVGKTYNLRILKNIPYTVRNRGDAAIDIQVDVAIPKKEELLEGYEAIPDPTWVKIVPNRFNVPGGQTAYAEMILQVPNEPAFVGKHYQAKIWAHTLNPGLFAAGTQSRLRFSTGPGPETLKEEAKQKAMMTMDFDVTPPEIYVRDLEPGKTYNLNERVQRKLKITNRAESPIRMKFKSIPWVSTVNLAPDFTPAPDPSWLKFSPEEAQVKGDRIETIDPVLTIPSGDEQYGKKYAFLMKVDLVMGVDLEVYTKVYVTTKAKPE